MLGLGGEIREFDFLWIASFKLEWNHAPLIENQNLLSRKIVTKGEILNCTSNQDNYSLYLKSFCHLNPPS